MRPLLALCCLSLAIIGCDPDPGISDGGEGGGAAGGNTAGGATAGGATAGGATAGGATAGGGEAGGSSAGGSAGGGTAGGSAGGATAGGSAGGSAGGTAGGMAGDGGFYGAARCGTAGVRFCDDFEQGYLDAGMWLPQINNGTITIDSMHVARGGKALHVHVENGQGNRARLRNTSQFQPNNYANGIYFGRAFIYMTPATTKQHQSFVGTSGDLDNPDGGASKLTSVYAVDMANNGLVSHFGLREGSTVLYDTGARSSTPPPIGHWACLEWKWDSVHDEEHLWLDEVEIPAAAVLQGMKWYSAQKYDQLALGFQMYHTEDAGHAAYDVWYDSVALDDMRIGCRE
ncbi:MAG: hypothetical protein IPJ65_07125 [Archangiaceae bacterium]|nr:hypothetical protein [Archangiaceae bacterium]